MWSIFLTLFIFAISSCFAYKFYLICKLRYPRQQKCLVRKTAMVTGANRGMGYYVALDFAKRGARVILACRNKEKAEEAKRNIIKETNNTDVIVKVVNLGSFRSIRTFAYEILRTETRLDILVNNAGISRPNSLTEDGYHPTLQVNALGPFLLTILLINLLKSTENSRVINLSDKKAVKYSDLLEDFIDKKDGLLAYAINYANSKKCQSLLMLELAERLRGTRISVHFSIPRPCKTPLQVYENWPDLVRFFQQTISFYFFYSDIEDSSQNTIFCALSDRLTETTGKFWKDCEQISLYPDNINLGELRKIVWMKCAKMVQLSSNEMNV